MQDRAFSSSSSGQRHRQTGPVQPPESPRRLFLRAAAALAASCAGPMTALAQGTGYEVSDWDGPLAGIGLADTTGKVWEFADLAGRAVLINFWATWCEPCRAEMPALQRVADRHGSARLLVLAVNFKEPPARAIRFARDSRLTLPVLLDLEGKAAARWGVRIFPTTLLIDSRGRPRQRVRGELEWDGPVAGDLIRGLLANP
jgi:thiol-disulfide isomerase/thioredoxin